MKCLAFVTILCLVCAFERTSADNQMEMVDEAIKQCKEDTGASEQDLENLSNGISPSTPEGKCMSSCLAKKYNLVI